MGSGGLGGAEVASRRYVGMRGGVPSRGLRLVADRDLARAGGRQPCPAHHGCVVRAGYIAWGGRGHIGRRRIPAAQGAPYRCGPCTAGTALAFSLPRGH